MKNDQTGRLSHGTPLIYAHTGSILDFDFSPFFTNLIVTASEDCTCKIWEIPGDGMVEMMRDPVVTMEGFQKKVKNIGLLKTVWLHWFRETKNNLFFMKKQSFTTSKDRKMHLIQINMFNE